MQVPLTPENERMSTLNKGPVHKGNESSSSHQFSGDTPAKFNIFSKTDGWKTSLSFWVPVSSYYWVVVSNIFFIFHPYLGKISNLAKIFLQPGWFPEFHVFSGWILALDFRMLWLHPRHQFHLLRGEKKPRQNPFTTGRESILCLTKDSNIFWNNEDCGIRMITRWAPTFLRPFIGILKLLITGRCPPFKNQDWILFRINRRPKWSHLVVTWRLVSIFFLGIPQSLKWSQNKMWWL